MNLLFVCNQGKNRSKTAAELFATECQTRYKGLFGNLLTKKDLLWADMVIVMEPFQRAEIGKRFPKEYLRKQINSPDIPDLYRYNQSELKEQLLRKMVMVTPLLEL